MDGALAIIGLSARGFVAILEIAREEVTSQASLARRLDIGGSTASELLKRLRRRGLVTLAPRSAGRRGGATTAPGATAGTATGGRPPTAVALTPAGRAVLEEAARIGQKLEREWALRLSADRADRPFPTARAYGVRRWLTESTAALRRRTPATGR